MRRRALAFLVCPACEAELEERVLQAEGDEIAEGSLRCTSCRRVYPIARGVPRFVAADAADADARAATPMHRHFAWQARRFQRMGSGPRDLPVQLESFVAPLGPADFAGRCVADLGCGSGRFARVAASWGASDVLAFDASDAVDAARDTTRDRPEVHVAQADLRRLPLRHGGAAQVDVAFAIGVLHHLEDPAGALAAMAEVVRSGGRACAWVYASEGNAWLARYADPIRSRVTARMPPAAVWCLSLALGALVHPVAKLVGAGWLAGIPQRDYLAWLDRFPFRHTHAVLHDHLTTSLTRYVPREDFASWFRAAGLGDVGIRSRNGNSWSGLATRP